jgi:hypothetical protein
MEAALLGRTSFGCDINPLSQIFVRARLGHNSKAVHRAYAKRAQMKIPSLEEYEQRVTSGQQCQPR